MTRYCSECGKEVSDNAKFCSECGKQIDEKKAPIGDTFKKRHARKGLKKAVSVIIIIFAVVILVYVFYTYLEFNGFISTTDWLSGTWEGSGIFTNNCDNPACKYVGTMNPPSVILQLQQDGNYVFGTITRNIPQSQVTELLGQPCYGFDNSVSDIYNGVLSGNRLTFVDIGENIWTLNFLNDNCQGTVDSNAIGCTGLQGDISLSKK